MWSDTNVCIIKNNKVEKFVLEIHVNKRLPKSKVVKYLNKEFKNTSDSKNVRIKYHLNYP